MQHYESSLEDLGINCFVAPPFFHLFSLDSRITFAYIAMLARLFISWLIFLIFSPPLYAMTYAQMKELKGADILTERLDSVFRDYGMPASIMDFGLDSRKPRREVAWGSFQAEPHR